LSRDGGEAAKEEPIDEALPNRKVVELDLNLAIGDLGPTGRQFLPGGVDRRFQDLFQALDGPPNLGIELDPSEGIRHQTRRPLGTICFHPQAAGVEDFIPIVLQAEDASFPLEPAFQAFFRLLFRFAPDESRKGLRTPLVFLANPFEGNRPNEGLQGLHRPQRRADWLYVRKSAIQG
jgi:hypothetical protein